MASFFINDEACFKVLPRGFCFRVAPRGFCFKVAPRGFCFRVAPRGFCFRVAPRGSCFTARTSGTLLLGLFELFVIGKCRLFVGAIVVFDVVLGSLFWNARAAAFSLICVARFFLVALAVDAAAFNDDSVLEYSFEVRATFVDEIGLFCAFALISAIFACRASFFACNPFDNADPLLLEWFVENPENLETISFTLVPEAFEAKLTSEADAGGFPFLSSSWLSENSCIFVSVSTSDFFP
mmetsp:Transcript_16267/g.45036  ORF Transcript_16267/g.45036 Transcript_16267/m.45036 type:complete len:238 (+) Transcript_16267:584-1297(+)